ncbi:MAG TPA: SDR family oxidoreductase [Euzebyales bacterium]|nr:SDR family oxidoreductase [Euzebyales bacterium]
MTATADIAVTGATGGVGGLVARRLAERGIAQRLVARDPARVPEVAGAQTAQAAYDDGDAMRRALEGVRTLLLVSGREDRDRLEQHRTAIDAAVAAGVERAVYTSFLGAAPDATFTFSRDHYHTEQHLCAVGLRMVSLRDSLYTDVLPSFVSGGVIRGPAGDGRFAPVTRGDVADMAVTALLDERYDGTTFDVTGPELVSMADIAALLTETLGEPVRYEDETLEEAYASRASFGAPEWEVTGWVTSYAAIATGALEIVTDTVEAVTGRPPVSPRDYLRRAFPRA